MALMTSALLRSWLEESPESFYVRLAGYWMSLAGTDGGDYRADPGVSGNRLIDGLVAACVERVASLRGEQSPDWTSHAARSGPEPVWHPGPGGMLPWALVHAPASFRARALLVAADSLQVA